MLRLITLAILTAGFSMPTPAAANPLDRYAWNARLFVVLVDSADSPELTRQQADIALNRDGYADRDLIVFIFAGDRLLSSAPSQEIDLDGASVRAHLGLPDSPFAAALVGLDTGVALRSAEPVSACELFREIDGMPIRRRDIEFKGGAVDCRPVPD